MAKLLTQPPSSLWLGLTVLEADPKRSSISRVMLGSPAVALATEHSGSAAQVASPVPSDFRYWQASQEPKIKLARALAERLLGFDLCPPDEAMERFIADMWAGDPIAERFVDEVFFGEIGPRRGRNMLDEALAEGVDALPSPPESMRALFEQLETVPD